MEIDLRKSDDSHVNIRFSDNHFFQIISGSNDNLVSLIAREKYGFTYPLQHAGYAGHTGISIRPEDIDNMIKALKTVKKYI